MVPIISLFNTDFYVGNTFTPFISYPVDITARGYGSSSFYDNSLSYRYLDYANDFLYACADSNYMDPIIISKLYIPSKPDVIID